MHFFTKPDAACDVTAGARKMLHEVTWTPDGGERRLGQGNATTWEHQQIMHSCLEGQYSLLRMPSKPINHHFGLNSVWFHMVFGPLLMLQGKSSLGSHSTFTAGFQTWTGLEICVSLLTESYKIPYFKMQLFIPILSGDLRLASSLSYEQN